MWSVFPQAQVLADVTYPVAVANYVLAPGQECGLRFLP